MPSPKPVPVPAIGVGAIVFDAHGRILLIRRGQPPAEGLWSLPGGRLEPGETMSACCRREVLEETGAAVVPGPIVAVVERVLEGFHYVIVDFAATLEQPGTPDLHPADDVSDARWIAPEELAGYRLVEGLPRILALAKSCTEGVNRAGLHDPDGDGWDFIPERGR